MGRCLLRSQSGEDGHGNRGQGDYIERIELLEELREDVQRIGHAAVQGIGPSPEGGRHDAADHFAGSFLGLEDAEERIDRGGNQSQRPDVEADTGPAGGEALGVVTGEPGQRGAVLVEGHPEENDHGEDHDKGDDPALLLLLGEFLDRSGRRRSGLFGVDIGMLEPLAAAQVDGDGNDQGYAGHGEAHVVGAGQVVDIVLGESGEVPVRNPGHLAHQRLQLGCILRGDRPIEVLVRQGRDISFVDQAGLAEEMVGDGRGGGRSEHGADVDGHVEEGEGGVTLGRVFRVVIQVAYEHLQIALEQAGTHRDQEQGQDHESQSDGVGRRRDGQAHIAREHDADAGDDAFSETDLVGEHAAENRHEVHRCQEDGIILVGDRLRETELGLEEKHEDRQHRVVAEALAGVGERKGEQTFGLSFEHSCLH